MKPTNNGTINGSPTAGPAQSRRLLFPDEFALPAVCGQTGKPFLMVVRRQGSAVLELIRAVAIEAAPSANGVPVRRVDPPPRTQAGAASRTALNKCAGGGMSEDPAVSFQALNMRARIHIGNLYDGCPYCRAPGYFHCSDCAIFSCWDSYNERPHLDHTDVWCEACRSWKCTSEQDEDDDSLGEVTAYAVREDTVDLQSRIAPGSTRRDQIDRSTSIRSDLKYLN
jgi:hypothetical protein